MHHQRSTTFTLLNLRNTFGEVNHKLIKLTMVHRHFKKKLSYDIYTDQEANKTHQFKVKIHEAKARLCGADAKFEGKFMRDQRYDKSQKF